MGQPPTQSNAIADRPAQLEYFRDAQQQTLTIDWWLGVPNFARRHSDGQRAHVCLIGMPDELELGFQSITMTAPVIEFWGPLSVLTVLIIGSMNSHL